MRIKGKRGVSGVVATMLLVALTVLVASVAWFVVDGIVQDSTEQSESCFGILDELAIRDRGTCYDSDNNGGTMSVYIERRDIELDSILVSIAGELKTETFEIDSESDRNLLGKNSGNVYKFRAGESFGEIQQVKITPVINGNTCESTDSVNNIESCSTLA